MSRSVSDTPEDFDAVVVGSGFGGAVTAYRLAEAGQRVCVLERGKPYPPGSFPRSPYAMSRNFWDPSEGLYGLYNLWSFSGIDSLVSSGLGGGSLIYANVALRKDERWFVHENVGQGGFEHWPVTRGDLDPHYDRVERMLNVQRYPFSQAPYNSTSKTRAFKEAADRLGLEWSLPPLAVTFANENDSPATGEPIREPANLHGKTRLTCRLVGECNVGCNSGSKNSLDFNYLSRAADKGAVIRTRAEVRTFEPYRGAYRIAYVEHDPVREGCPGDTSDPTVYPERTVVAKRLILSAGTFGSTYLLLKNAKSFPLINRRALGSRFSGNGDLLSFAVRAREERAGGRVPRVINPTYGPVITSTVRVPDALDDPKLPRDARGFYVQDAGFPDFAAWMLQAVNEPAGLWAWRKVLERLVRKRLQHDPETDLGAEAAALLSRNELSAGLLPLLGMGRDVPDGRMSLVHGKLEVDWRKERGSKRYFERVRACMRQLSAALGASFRMNPTWLLSRVVTVHPLGGCPMGRTSEEGVVDSYGEVFNYPGLYVADGSVMPGPVGANPSLTIAALADRFADRMV